MWAEKFSDKLVDAATAIGLIKSGQRVFIGSGAAEPQGLVAALTQLNGNLRGLEIIHILTLGIAPYTEPKFSSVFRHNAFFIGANVREAVAAGRADYTPIFLSEIPRLLRGGRLPIDVALIQVSPPDDHGFCSYGVSVDIVKAGAESARMVIAEVNPLMPRTLGDSFIHVSRITKLVLNPCPLPESVPAPPDEVAEEIGRNVARLIDDGSTLQMGIGTIPNAVLRYLGTKKNLGIHTEMFSDGIIDLIESGVIDCSQKTLLPGKVVTSFCFGTRRLYDYIDNNPLFEFRPSEFVNDPFVIARNSKMVAVNSALAIDTTGQVSADSIGHRFYSGIGGQVDFIRGAARSEGGKPIIVLPSTAKGGTVSRIVPSLKEGAGVVTSRGDIHFVVTEFGVADLWGKNVRDRALALISIAHPKFRDELLEEAKQHKLVYSDQILASTAEYPEELETKVEFEPDLEIFFRPIKPTDEQLVKDLLYACSEKNYHRFIRSQDPISHTILQRLVNVDYKSEMCVVGIISDRDREALVALGHYEVEKESGMADASLLVRDDFQRHGIGSFLVNYLIKVAYTHGVSGMKAEVDQEVHPITHWMPPTGKDVKSGMHPDDGYRVELHWSTGQHKTTEPETVPVPA